MYRRKFNNVMLIFILLYQVLYMPNDFRIRGAVHSSSYSSQESNCRTVPSSLAWIVSPPRRRLLSILFSCGCCAIFILVFFILHLQIGEYGIIKYIVHAYQIKHKRTRSMRLQRTGKRDLPPNLRLSIEAIIHALPRGSTVMYFSGVSRRITSLPKVGQCSICGALTFVVFSKSMMEKHPESEPTTRTSRLYPDMRSARR